MFITIVRNQRPRIETFRFWEEYDYEYEIFSVVFKVVVLGSEPASFGQENVVAVRVIPLRVLARVS